MLRRGGGELSALWLLASAESPNAIIWVHEVADMKSRQGYKGYVIVARSCELQDGGFAAEFSVEEHGCGWGHGN